MCTLDLENTSGGKAHAIRFAVGMVWYGMVIFYMT